jgi:hypothetical protein
MSDYPLISFNSEKFQILIHEEDKISEEKIKFDAAGLIKDSIHYQLIYAYG